MHCFLPGRGMGGGIAASINQLLFFRGMMGIGVGFIIPLSTGLIADFYSGSDRTVMMGYSTAVNNLGGIIASIFQISATVNWRLSFTVYAMALLVLLLTLKFLREPSVTVELKPRTTGSEQAYGSLHWSCILFLSYSIRRR